MIKIDPNNEQHKASGYAFKTVCSYDSQANSGLMYNWRQNNDHITFICGLIKDLLGEVERWKRMIAEHFISKKNDPHTTATRGLRSSD